jgi:hypothetical protein
MTYFFDLTQYSYSGREGPQVLNVGWLDRPNPKMGL